MADTLNPVANGPGAPQFAAPQQRTSGTNVRPYILGGFAVIASLVLGTVLWGARTSLAGAVIAPATVVVMWMIFGGLHASGYVKWMESLGSETVQETVKLLQESKDPLVIGLMAATAVLVAPVCEEVVFRGYFYPVAKRFAGAWPAALCSAMVFAAAHGNLTALLPLFLFGLALVFIYEKTGSLWAPVAVHFCFNGATVVAQLAVRYLDIPVEQLSR